MRGASLLAAFVVGLMFGFTHLPMSIGFAIASVAIAGMWVAGKLRKNPLKLKTSHYYFNYAAYFLFSALGIIDVGVHQKTDYPISPEVFYPIEGVVDARRTLTSSEMYTLNLKRIGEQREEGVMTLFAAPGAIFQPGEIIRFNSQLSEQPTSSFEKRRLVGRAYQPEKVRIIGESMLPKYLFAGCRERVNSDITRLKISDETKNLLRALILADRSGMERHEIDLLRNGGAIHTLAVSGMHIGIVAAILLVLTAPLSLIGCRKWRYVLVIFGVWLFVMLTGASYSAIRAALMLSIACAGWMMERKRDAFSALCFAVFFILIFDPHAITDAGLQLSFVSVAALTLLGRPLNPIDHRKHPRIHSVYSMVLSTLIATAATWLLGGYHFGSAPIRFLPANMLILPALPAYMTAALSYLGLSSIGIDIDILGRLIDIAPEYLFQFLERISAPSLNIQVGLTTVSLWLIAMLTAGLTFRLKSNSVVLSLLNTPIRLKPLLFGGSAILALISLGLLPFNL